MRPRILETEFGTEHYKGKLTLTISTKGKHSFELNYSNTINNYENSRTFTSVNDVFNVTSSVQLNLIEKMPKPTNMINEFYELHEFIKLCEYYINSLINNLFQLTYTEKVK